MKLCLARRKHGAGRCRRPAMVNGRCIKHGGRTNPRQWRRWQPGIAAAHIAYAQLRALGVKTGGRPVGFRLRPRIEITKLQLVSALANELLERLPISPQGAGEVDLMLEAWRLGIGHIITMFRDPDYKPGQDLKRDRLVGELTQGIGSHLVRIGEGLLQREKHDRIAELLEKLKAPEVGEKKTKVRK